MSEQIQQDMSDISLQIETNENIINDRHDELIKLYNKTRELKTVVDELDKIISIQQKQIDAIKKETKETKNMAKNTLKILKEQEENGDKCIIT